MDLWTRLWGRYHVPQNVFLVINTLTGRDAAVRCWSWAWNWGWVCLSRRPVTPQFPHVVAICRLQDLSHRPRWCTGRLRQSSENHSFLVSWWSVYIDWLIDRLIDHLIIRCRQAICLRLNGAHTAINWIFLGYLLNYVILYIFNVICGNSRFFVYFIDICGNVVGYLTQ